MQSRHSFHVTVALAIGFGATLSYAVSSSTAVGYPSGPAVSMGANPVWAQGGVVDSSTHTIVLAPAGRDVIVTDVVMSYFNGGCNSRVEIRTNSGAILANFRLFHDYDSDKTMQPTTIQHSFVSGLPVPAGETLLLQEFDGCDVAYSLSGYYAQP